MTNKNDVIYQSKHNPLLADIIKFWMAIHSDTCINGFYSQDYILEKLEGIMKGNSVWHARIEECYKQQLEEICGEK